MAGSLVELKQMGFALAFGVLLDTLVVRSILVPAFLIIVYRWHERHQTPSQSPAERGTPVGTAHEVSGSVNAPPAYSRRGS
jgi:RND superfamily putative drug exporter